MTIENIFNKCKEIYNLEGENKQREELYRLLEILKRENEAMEYPNFLNHLIRELGIYPYIHKDSSILSDKITYECFKVDTGCGELQVFHREQSMVLKKLLNDKNLLLSAPTSFGKSFIIDSTIAIKQPSNILIIVPTISLMDETRRRLTQKFGKNYNIITTKNAELKENNNILIFPQERAIKYIDKLKQCGLDLFIVDEFYKISTDDRKSILQFVIKKYKEFAKQIYFICPNAKEIKDLSKDFKFLQDMEKEIVDFKTVVLNRNDMRKDRGTKQEKIKRILQENYKDKTLIYVATKTNSKRISKFISENNIFEQKDEELKIFAKWLRKHYANDWDFSNFIEQGIGQHNANIHRYIQQIQVKLFNDNLNFNVMVSTTSLIEGVNTAAKNVILYDNAVADEPLSNLAYGNIIGRAGRMFKYFVGNIYLIDDKKEVDNMDNDIIVNIEPCEDFEYREEIKLTDKNRELEEILRKLLNNNGKFREILKEIKNYNISTTLDKVIDIVEFLQQNIKSLQCLSYNEADRWSIIKTYRGKENSLISIFTKNNSNKKEQAFRHIIDFAKFNWEGINCLLSKGYKLTINDYFEYEKIITFDIAAFFNDINIIQQIMYPERQINISSFVEKLSNAFLPSVVFQLEEYGLPRMISKKIHNCNIINFEDNDLSINDAIKQLRFNRENIVEELKKKNLYDDFDEYILDYFYSGLANNN